MTKLYIQGDIQLEPCQPQMGKVQKHNGSFVLAIGETTGHKHLLQVENPMQIEVIKDANGDTFINLLQEGTLIHEEHGTQKIAAGWYKFGQENEFDYWELTTRKVID